ncbi:MAG TPA: alpha/beta hydrolase [Dehalococcoidia bacterium]
MPPKDGFARVNGLTLHYVDWGGDGPPLLLSHPTGFLARVWDPLAERLAERFHVVGYDVRGHGDSDKPEGGYSWQVLTSDLRGMLAALGLEGPVGMGHSAGATALALLEAEHPGTFSRLVLIDPIIVSPALQTGPGPGPQPNPMAERARKRRMVWDSLEEIRESYAGRPPFRTWRREFLEAYVEHGTRPLPDGRRELKCPGAVEAQMYQMVSGHRRDPLEALGDVRCPVLLLAGETSDAFPPDRARRVAAALPACRFVTVPGTTHFVPMERPEAVLDELDRFLSD